MPELVLHANGRTWALDASRSYTIGRDQQADISCIDRRVSRRHLVIRCDGGTWVIEDLGSANGTFADGRRIQRMEIGHGSIIRLGNVSTGMRLDFTGVLTGAPAAVGGDQARADVPIPAGPPRGETRPRARGAMDGGTPEAAATPPVVPGPRAGEAPGAPTGAA
ncbi:FHA domain-containing protein, partial [Streptomyces sp. SID8382]|nr:FHA domain-containing protein [Streptomyces sp. SID8382]